VGALGALKGPLHGGAPGPALDMVFEIGELAHAERYLRTKLDAGERLMGFGHRIYTSYDPRATIIKQVAEDVFAVTGTNPLIEIALELERIALNDEYFIAHKLYPNVDFYSGIILQAMRFPTDMFPVLFAIPRAAGWLAQWIEMLNDPAQKIARPRQIYTGQEKRTYVPIEERAAA
jgi:citrate synthase